MVDISQQIGFMMKQTVSKDDPVLNDCYKDLMDYLDWPEVFEDDRGVYRFKGKRLALAINKFTKGEIFNQLVLDYYDKKITLHEWMQFYIYTETSLGAFLEVFERRIWPQNEETESHPVPIQFILVE